MSSSGEGRAGESFEGAFEEARPEKTAADFPVFFMTVFLKLLKFTCYHQNNTKAAEKTIM